MKLADIIRTGHLCQAGDGCEYSALYIDGVELMDILEEYFVEQRGGVLFQGHQQKVEMLPGMTEPPKFSLFSNHLQRDYGKVKITVEFLDEEEAQ